MYGLSDHSKHSTYRRLSSTFRSRYGRKEAKSLVRRASTQAWWPRAPWSVISARSSDGTRRAFSQSRRVTRTRLRSSASYGSDATSGSARSSKRPISSSVNRSCAILPRVESCSARASVPRDGIVTR